MLELARVREQLGKFEEANRLYKFALGIPDLPLIVRDNVTKRLNNIRGRQGFIDYSVALVSDDNPLNFTDANEITFAGLRFQISAPPENKTVYGLEHSLLTVSHLSNKYSVITNHLFLDYASQKLDELFSKVVFQRKLNSEKLNSIFIGREAEFNRNGTIYSKDNIGLNFNKTYVFNTPIIPTISYGRLEVSNANYLNKNSFEFSAVAEISDFPSVPVDLIFIAEKHEAKENPYSHDRVGAGIRSDNYFLDNKMSSQLNVIFYRDTYAEVDPLFGKTRQDMTAQFKGEITHQSWRVFSKQFYLGFRYKENKSNLAFFRYETSGIYFRIN